MLAGIRVKTASLTKNHGAQRLRTFRPPILRQSLGVKGLGEIGIVGTAAAIANAVYHATGKRIRDLPITIDKVLA